MLVPLLVTGLLLSAADNPAAAECRLIGNDLARLACYDRVFGHPEHRTEATGNDTSAPVSRSVSTADTGSAPGAVSAEDDFGLTEAQRESRQPDRRPRPDSISSKIASVQKLARDRYVLSLENGQRWLQLEPTPRQRFYAGDDIVIQIGALNSFLASGPHSGTIVRVRRLD